MITMLTFMIFATVASSCIDGIYIGRLNLVDGSYQFNQIYKKTVKDVKINPPNTVIYSITLPGISVFVSFNEQIIEFQNIIFTVLIKKLIEEFS